jgi:PAS domain S-box-containing protein
MSQEPDDKKIPLSWDEASRIDALRALKLLDTPAEERFDLITRRARDTFKVPIALISLVDTDRQWFKSRDGLDTPETSRATSFCTHAILQDGIYIVPDAQADPMFAENPLVTGEPNFRFYAGKPLRSPEGKKIGTLCLIDRVPREFNEEAQAKLQSLGDWAEREIKHYAAETSAFDRLESRLRLAHAFENSTDGIISTDLSGKIESANQAACDMFRYRANDVVGRNISELIPARQRGQHVDFMLRLRTGSAGDARNCLEITALRTSGEEFPAEVSFRKMEAGERHFFTGIVRDITERKNIERIKSEFVASVSHELRTPLTAILGALGMLREEAATNSGDARELIEIAYLNSKRLNTLANDILDTEKLDAGMMSFEQEIVTLKEFVSDMLRLNQPFARSEGITLQVQEAGVPLKARVDRSRLTQVLTNLVSNACKFSPAGSVVAIRTEAQDKWAVISVVDKGPGIPNEFRNRIFQRFAQAHVARDHQKTGTGLGLSISKTMVEKMGGRIGYDSVEGQGATFYVRLPLITNT